MKKKYEKPVVTIFKTKILTQILLISPNAYSNQNMEVFEDGIVETEVW